MDPQAALNELLSALQQQEEEEALEYAFSLLKWLDRGGFLPKISQPIQIPSWLDSESPLALRVSWLNQILLGN